MIYDPITSCHNLYLTAVFFSHFFPFSFSLPFLKLSLNFIRNNFSYATSYSFYSSLGNGLFEYSYYFRNARWSYCVLWRLITALYSFLSKHHPGEQRFYLISQCCNLLEMKAILKYNTYCEFCFMRMVLKVCVSFYCCHCMRIRLKLSIVTGNEKNVFW